MFIKDKVAHVGWLLFCYFYYEIDVDDILY